MFRFRVDLQGENVTPETTRLRDLIELAADLETALIETARAKGEPISDDTLVSLVGIEEGSNRLTLAVSAGLVTAASVLTNALAAHSYSSIPRKAHEALVDISRLAENRRWQIQFVGEADGKIKGCTIGEQNKVPPPEEEKPIIGTTTIYGRCIRVGGVKPRAELRLMDGNTLYVDLSEAMAKQLAQRLYEEVALEGDIIWKAPDWIIDKFTPRRLTSYHTTDVAMAFAELSRAAKGRFDGVDAKNYVSSLRKREEAI